MNLLGKEDDVLSLDRIRATLIRLEDTIIFSLIERAQFAWNPKLYQPGAIPELASSGHQGSWLDWFLRETESMHAKVRRYESPDEYSFTPKELLSKPILPPLNYPRLLHPNNVNVNDKIKDFYINKIIPAITSRATSQLKGGVTDDDGNYGSAACRDVEALQAISRRIHYGMFVSESKFRSAPADFIPHIYSRNTEALAGLITKPAVEAALLKRLAKKAAFYGQELDAAGNPKTTLDQVEKENLKIDVEEVVALYRDYIIPLTKEVEVEYLLTRLQGLSQEEIDTLKNTPSSH
ncbi:chorismate mutase [Cystobasidium minutum MCA 4210]|uniref:chorismate mutase n=1 Tax=Cystobasidium minutum MCA 4210 TaxID=1397322 RepID=UPI0034CF8D50|eukprot:jgi/Rhomi1/79321/CE79320_294